MIALASAFTFFGTMTFALTCIVGLAIIIWNALR